MKNIMKNILAVFFIYALSIAPVFAHGGEIEVSGGGVRGPVQLSPEQEKALDLKTEVLDFRPLANLLDIYGEAQIPPDRQADVTSRISGQVTEIYVGLGDRVKAGQDLARIEGRVIGNASVTLKAPMDGVIDARDIVKGQAVEPGSRLFHISDRSKMIIKGKVYEEDLGKAKYEQEARIHLLAYPDKALTGKVRLIEPDIDPLTRTVKMWIEVDNSEDLIKPHMFARIGIVLSKNDAALAVSNRAIIEANGEMFVFVREGNKFKRVEIKIGAADDEYSEVLDNLIPGDEVVTQGNREVYTIWLTGGQTNDDEEDED